MAQAAGGSARGNRMLTGRVLSSWLQMAMWAKRDSTLLATLHVLLETTWSFQELRGKILIIHEPVS